ncbi:MAG TPA: FtsX-like permease family protein [Halanaerobiales bacterium]|nr:FtsX-like permease family protein [Halanaerobiales bacterium]
MLLLRLALRNLFRYKKRTILTAFIIAFAIMFYVFADSLVVGMMESSYENIIDFEFGHIQIVERDYWEERTDYPLENLIKADDDLLQEINERFEIVNSSPRLEFVAQMSDGWDELPVIGRGIEAEREKQTFQLEEALVEGSFLIPGERQAVIGRDLADDMQLEIGDVFTLRVRARREDFNIIDLEICGLVNTPNPFINGNLVYLPLELAQEALVVGDSYSHLSLSISERGHSQEMAAEISSMLAENKSTYHAYPWERGAEDLIAMKEYSDNMMILILGVILLMAAAGVVNTILLSVLERLKEIGTMKAMGLKIKEITLVLTAEAGGIGLIGGILGCLLGIIVVGLFSIYGINLYAGLEGEFDLPISMARIYGRWNPGAFVFVFFYSIIVSTLAGLFPGYWGACKKPVDALEPK